MTLQDFIAQKNGQIGVGDTSGNKGKCVGLVEAFFDTMGLAHIWGNACDMPADADLNTFDVVSNTPIYIPPVGAAVAFPAGWEGSSVGHVAIVAPGTTASVLVIFEANDRIGGGNGAARLHTFSYNTGLTAAQVAAGWPKFIVPKILNQPAPAPAPAPVPSSAEGTFNVLTPLPGYTTSAAAAARLNPTVTVPAGNYAIFNQAHGMVNVTHNAGVPGSWVNPADNEAPAAAPGPAPAGYDGNAVTIQPGWGLSNAAQAAGYPDFSSPIRWAAIAALNGSNDWQAFNPTLKPGQRIVVGKYEAPAPAAPAPAPTPEAAPAAGNIIYTKLSEVLNLVTNKNPTHVWQLDFANDTEAHAAYDLPEGAPFGAYGKAQRTDGDKPCYYMTQEDFGSAELTHAPVNNRGVNTVDLSTPAPIVEQAAVQETPAAAPVADGTPVGVTAIPDLDKRYLYTGFASPLEYVTIKPDDAIVEVQGLNNADGTPTYPNRELLLHQPVTVAGTITIAGVPYYRTAIGVKNGTYYAIPMADLEPVTATPTSKALKAAATVEGFFAKLFHRKPKVGA